MRKIEQEMIEAISKGKDYKKDNTEVQVLESNGTWVTLHRNLIATVYEFPDKIELRVQDATYQTKTTKSRLNCILSYYNLLTIYSKKFQWYIGDEKWLGTKTFEINNGH